MMNTKYNSKPEVTMLQRIYSDYLKVIIILLKERKVYQLEATVLIFISFVQMGGWLFAENGYIEWEETILDGLFYNLASQSQMIPYFAETKSFIIYCTTYVFCKLLVN